MHIIFLNIDGVLLPESRVTPRIHLEQLYAERKTDPSKQDFSAKALNQAAVRLLRQRALNQLDTYINALEKKGEKVGIIVTDWRLKGTIAELQEFYEPHAFSKKIIGKTALRIIIRDNQINFRSLGYASPNEIFTNEIGVLQ